MELKYLKDLAEMSIDELEAKGMGGIIVGERYVYTIEPEEPGLVRYPRKAKLAECSGAYYARTALRLGHNAVEAVKIAIKLDCYSGGKIKSVDL